MADNTHKCLQLAPDQTDSYLAMKCHHCPALWEFESLWSKPTRSIFSIHHLSINVITLFLVFEFFSRDIHASFSIQLIIYMLFKYKHYHFFFFLTYNKSSKSREIWNFKHNFPLRRELNNVIKVNVINYRWARHMNFKIITNK